MYFDIFKKVVNRNKSNNVVFYQYILKWNKHTEILPPIICNETQIRTRNLTITITITNNNGHGITNHINGIVYCIRCDVYLVGEK